MILLDKKTIYVIVAVVVVVLVVGVAGVMLLNNGGNGDTNPTPTPTAEPSVADATSIQFTVVDSGAGLTYQYQCKNLNADDEMLRVDMDLGGMVYNYIIDMGTMESWMSEDGTTWNTGDFAADCTDYATPFHAYLDKIVENGGTADFTYAGDAGDVTISGITVNPTIEDSVFATS